MGGGGSARQCRPSSRPRAGHGHRTAAHSLLHGDHCNQDIFMPQAFTGSCFANLNNQSTVNMLVRPLSGSARGRVGAGTATGAFGSKQNPVDWLCPTLILPALSAGLMASGPLEHGDILAGEDSSQYASNTVNCDPPAYADATCRVAPPQPRSFGAQVCTAGARRRLVPPACACDAAHGPAHMDAPLASPAVCAL